MQELISRLLDALIVMFAYWSLDLTVGRRVHPWSDGLRVRLEATQRVLYPSGRDKKVFTKSWRDIYAPWVLGGRGDRLIKKSDIEAWLRENVSRTETVELYIVVRRVGGTSVRHPFRAEGIVHGEIYKDPPSCLVSALAARPTLSKKQQAAVRARLWEELETVLREESCVHIQGEIDVFFQIPQLNERYAAELSEWLENEAWAGDEMRAEEVELLDGHGFCMVGRSEHGSGPARVPARLFQLPAKAGSSQDAATAYPRIWKTHHLWQFVWKGDGNDFAVLKERMRTIAQLCSELNRAQSTPAPARPPVPREKTSVAVVGAGLAGLVAAKTLCEQGVSATVYEASSRSGGRVSTSFPDWFEEDQFVERGGEFIGSDHRCLQALAGSLGLELDFVGDEPSSGGQDLLHLHGGVYDSVHLESDLAYLATVLNEERSRLGPGPAGERWRAALDRRSVREWVSWRIPAGDHGRESPLSTLLCLAAQVEYGGDPDDQSALNLITMLGEDLSVHALHRRLFGSSDEAYRVRGGNERLIDELSSLLAEPVRHGHELVAVESTDRNGGVHATFRCGTNYREIVAERLVLAIPFSTLRHVDLDRTKVSSEKRKAISELGMGRHSKLHLQFRERPWRDSWNGTTYSDAGSQCTWEETRGQEGEAGILVRYGADLEPAADDEAAVRDFFHQMEPLFPDLRKAWNGRKLFDNWPAHPYSRGSYSYFRVGQATTLSHHLGTAEGSVHFAGEHTSTEFQGYMEGAVRSGERAGNEVADALKAGT